MAPELFCVTHHVWGKGDQMHDYFSPSAELVHLAVEDDKQVLVSTLKTPARHGDEIDLFSRRVIHHGFKERREGWEYMPFNPTDNARIAIQFPVAKQPAGITVGNAPGTPAPFVSRPGTKEIILRVKSPTLRSRYRIDWSW